ncbi:PadR family transcriptional regulator [Spiroplasma endosymbiont of Anurida maritima]|uniref:PadR family transcriptional regulator n=1 Tax=Spiroplasma endosymbiont of Anurida maritima TaxID=2967972 RepID=UPI0036D38F46
MDTQFKKGILELIVLIYLEGDEKYGYQLNEEINKKIDTTESTIYALLKKLVLNDYCTTKLVQSSEGPARKYYAITDKGQERKENLIGEWKQFISSVNEILGEKVNDKR